MSRNREPHVVAPIVAEIQAEIYFSVNKIQMKVECHGKSSQKGSSRGSLFQLAQNKTTNLQSQGARAMLLNDGTKVVHLQQVVRCDSRQVARN